MAFTPEDGTGLSSANSFCDVAFADTYFADRGNPEAWDQADTAAKEVALVTATDYVDLRFNWVGTKGTSEQALTWPRYSAYDPDGHLLQGVPEPLKKAVCEYALRVLQSVSLAPDPVYQDSNQLVREKTEIIGPITETTKYFDGAPPLDIREYPTADVLLTPLIQKKRFWGRA
jgi:hypothetical protein